MHGRDRLPRMRKILFLVLAATLAHPPATKRVPVTDTYYDVKVVDDYRWLENANDPAVVKWVDEQREYARSILDAVPGREAIAKRLREWLTNRARSYGPLVLRARPPFALNVQPPS